MEAKILSVERTQLFRADLKTGVQQPVGGMQPIDSATFRCNCGNVWTAASSKRTFRNGFFAQSFTSISAECPECKQGWKWTLDEYKDL
jgi:hypothetical protein